ncbi:MAG TPA: GDSL-type esterase/lipase family protein [Thermoanaerobaculia bacterium]|nr:GDSL-type esterase/lipase family protein [Thermoanaerobaculia bacterium]
MSWRNSRALASNLLVPLALAGVLFLLLEGGCRAALRLRTGAWPETQVTAYTKFVEKIGKAYRPHPLLIVAGRPDAVLEAAGHVVHFNARGQRVTNVRDVPAPKPEGTYRVVCEGGSTTFDLLAPDDAGTWPARLGTLLRPRADVVNGGFPGWTSLESLVSLETRDLDLQPDLVIVFSGVNDLQPAGYVPFSPDYTAGHAEILPRVTGVAPVPVRLVSRLVFVEWLRGRLKPQGPAQAAEGYAPSYDWKGGPKRDDIPAEAVAVYKRNLRSTIAIAAAYGARTLLVAQSARVRAGHETADRDWLEGWTPGLTATGYLAGLARYNAVAKKLGDEGLALFLDPFLAGSFSDAHFQDPVHFSPAGSELFAKALAAFVDAPGGPRGAR